MKPRYSSFGVPFGLGALAAMIVACSGETAVRRTDGLDPSGMPDGIRADYQVFADRCSKCHSLTRPLNSGIDNDGYWATYVERMRRQPASGISREDVPVILRFLHYYVIQQQAAKAKKSDSASPATVTVQPGATVNLQPGATANVPAGTTVNVVPGTNTDGGM